MNIGEKISYIRNKQFISREELAERAGIGKTSIYNYETGKRDMTIDVLEKITDALNVPMSIFFKSSDTDDLIFEDMVNIYLAKLKRDNPQEPIIVEHEGVSHCINSTMSDSDLESLYEMNFSQMLNWRLSKIETYYEFFELVLSWYSIIDVNASINKADIQEMSSIFNRILLSKISEKALLDLLSEHNPDLVEPFIKNLNAAMITSEVKYGVPLSIFDLKHSEDLNDITED